MTLELEESVNSAEWLASLALTIETAMAEGGGAARDYVGAAHILADLMFDHAKKLGELFMSATGDATRED